MTGAVIGALRVNLGLDAAQFTVGTRKAAREADTFSTQLTASLKRAAAGFAAVGAAAAAMAAAVAVPVKRSIDRLDDLAKTAQKTGTTVEDLSKLRFAAGLSGVTDERLQAGLVRLNVALAQIGQDGAPKASRALEKLGVTAGTGTLDAMRQLAARFASMPDGALKTAAAIEIFGKAGADLIPLLNSGEAGLVKMAAEAERLGIVIDTGTAKSAELFNDNLRRLGTLAQGVVSQFTAGLLPTLSVVTSQLLQGASTGSAWADWGRLTGKAILVVAEAGMVAYEAISGLTRGIVSLFRAGAALQRGAGLSAAGGIISGADAETSRQIEARRRLFAQLRKDIETFKMPAAAVGIGAMGDFEGADGGAAGRALRVAADAAADFRRQINAIRDSLPRLSASIREGGSLLDEWLSGTESLINLSQLPDQLRELQVIVPDLRSAMDSAFATAVRFSEGLAANLSQALVFGQSLGDALKSSIRAAAAELITSGLLNLLLGRPSAGGLRSGGLLGAVFSAFIPGFANGTRSAPGGLAMVGERGRELVNLPRGAQVIPNSQTEAMLNRARQDPVELVVRTEPSPLFVTSVVQGSRGAARDELRRATRPRMLRSPGA